MKKAESEIEMILEPNLAVLEQVLKIYDDEIFLLQEQEEVNKFISNSSLTRNE